MNFFTFNHMSKVVLTTILLTLSLISCNTLKNSHVAQSSEAWEQKQLPSDLEVDHVLYVFGEMGASRLSQNPLTPHIRKVLGEADKHSTALFLGSHLYPKGLSGKKKSERDDQELELSDKFSLLKDYKGDYYFTSGEHDWEYRGDLGLKAVKRMEGFFEESLDKKHIFLPEGGCGDPYKLKVDADVILLFINSQWWFEDWENETGINKGCEVRSRTEFVDQLKEVILQNKNKQLVVVMHHPLFSNGVHGGNIPAKYHFFPLTELKEKAFLPLPFIGSTAAMHRKITGARQDLNHPKFRTLKEEILNITTTSRLKDIVFVAAHDRSLQYFHQSNQHFIVSGSAGGDGYARGGGAAEFASAKSGFSKLVFYKNKEAWLEFYGLTDEKLSLLYRHRLRSGASNEEEVLAEFDFGEIPDTMTAIAGPSYDVKKFRRFWFGNTYRDIWNTPLAVRTLDLTKERGGLTPLRKGGGQQSNSLRLEDPKGRQVVFRSIYKSAFKTTPVFAQGTWAENVLQDMLSGSHPYGAFVIPTLSEAAKVYYADPQLVYIPKQEGLGIYNESFGNELYLYEDRPAGNRKDLNSFGNSKKIIGINDLLPALDNNYDHVVDQKWVLKSRLFDMWLHDWDRHDDQWRWASDKKGDETVYRPIPRDRDQVFFTFDGPLPWLVSNFGLKKFRTFKHTLKAPHHHGCVP